MESAPHDADHTIARWRSAEAAARRLQREPGIVRQEQVAGRTGLQIFEALLAGDLPHAPMADTLDFLLVEASFGHVVFQGRPLTRRYNPMGSVHGGWFAALLDSALGCAVHTTLPVGKTHTTAELKTNIVWPLTDKVPLVRAEGRVIHGGSRMATADGRLTGADGSLYAHASTTCFVFDAS